MVLFLLNLGGFVMRWLLNWLQPTPIFEVGKLPEAIRHDDDGSQSLATNFVLRALKRETSVFFRSKILAGEFGCAEGELVDLMLAVRPGLRIIAVDKKKRIAKAYDSAERPTVEFANCSLCNLSRFNDKIFTVILSRLTIGYIDNDDLELATKEIVRVMSNGACLIVMDSHPRVDTLFALRIRPEKELGRDETLLMPSSSMPAPPGLVEADPMFLRGELVIPSAFQQAGLGVEQIADFNSCYRVHVFRKP